MKSRIFQREGEMFFLKLQYAENNKSCIYLDNVVWNIYSTSLSFFFFFLFNEKFYVLLFIREKKRSNLFQLHSGWNKIKFER